MKRAALAALTLLLLVLHGTVSADKPPGYFVDESLLPFEAIPGTSTSRYWGVHKKAGYRIEVPDAWNGDLVVWAHGFRGTGLELELTAGDPPPGLRLYLVENGYAWAASSYSRNDYDVSTGVQDTHALTKRFNGIVSKPNRTYLAGASMGGHITAVAIEQYPNTYDGAMPVCGAIGDYELFDFFLDFNVAAQQLGTGSSQYPVDPAAYLFLTLPQIKENLELFPGGWPLFLNSDGMNLMRLTELRSGGTRTGFVEAWWFWLSFPEFGSGIPGAFLFELGLGDGTFVRAPGVGIQNSDVVYQFDTDPALNPSEQAFNDAVFRLTADPQGRNPNGLSQVPVVNGDIGIPVLTMHNIGDLFVPIHNEVVYANEVASNGASDLLVQRAIRGIGHCDFTGAELVTGFTDLVNWVENGVKPDGDDLQDPAQTTDPLFGCDHTQGSHFGGDPLGLPGSSMLACP